MKRTFKGRRMTAADNNPLWRPITSARIFDAMGSVPLLSDIDEIDDGETEIRDRFERRVMETAWGRYE